MLKEQIKRKKLSNQKIKSRTKKERRGIIV
jgi:hypothetical protein